MSPSMCARATDIAVALLRECRVVERYASPMITGARVPPFIEQLTGISNRMLSTAPRAAQVMRDVAEFTADGLGPQVSKALPGSMPAA